MIQSPSQGVHDGTAEDRVRIIGFVDDGIRGPLQAEYRIIQRVDLRDLHFDSIRGSPCHGLVQPVHAVRVSNDGLVYVSDRGGKRVQVFSLDGKYVTQVFIDRYCEALHCGNGQTVASTAFSPDPEQRFLYVASRSPARVWVLDRKTLEPLDSFGRNGVAPGEFYVMHHMNVDAKGNLYVTEVQDGKRVQKFTFKGLAPLPGK